MQQTRGGTRPHQVDDLTHYKPLSRRFRALSTLPSPQLVLPRGSGERSSAAMLSQMFLLALSKGSSSSSSLVMLHVSLRMPRLPQP